MLRRSSFDNKYHVFFGLYMALLNCHSTRFWVVHTTSVFLTLVFQLWSMKIELRTSAVGYEHENSWLWQIEIELNSHSLSRKKQQFSGAVNTTINYSQCLVQKNLFQVQLQIRKATYKIFLKKTLNCTPSELLGNHEALTIKETIISDVSCPLSLVHT